MTVSFKGFPIFEEHKYLLKEKINSTAKIQKNNVKRFWEIVTTVRSFMKNVKSNKTECMITAKQGNTDTR